MTPLPRTLETEVMDTPEEAIDYDSMDHAQVNRLFVTDFLLAWERRSGAGVGGSHADSPRWRVLDLGTGTAQIPLELCRRNLFCDIVAVDLAEEMIKLAVRKVRQAGLESRIELRRDDSKQLSFPESRFDAVMSNSIVHHLPEPVRGFAEMLRVLRPGGLLFARDLMRPADLVTLESLVETYAGDANRHQRQMFRDSLHAALTLEEVREILTEFQLPADWARATSDRHWTIQGFLPPE